MKYVTSDVFRFYLQTKYILNITPPTTNNRVWVNYDSTLPRVISNGDGRVYKDFLRAPLIPLGGFWLHFRWWYVVWPDPSCFFGKDPQKLGCGPSLQSCLWSYRGVVVTSTQSSTSGGRLLLFWVYPERHRVFHDWNGPGGDGTTTTEPFLWEVPPTRQPHLNPWKIY